MNFRKKSTIYGTFFTFLLKTSVLLSASGGSRVKRERDDYSVPRLYNKGQRQSMR